MARPKILLIGCGRMGSALLQGWNGSKDLEVTVVDPSSTLTNVHKIDDLSEKEFDCIVLAVKPQAIDQVCTEILKSGLTSSLFISIAAGKSLLYLQERLQYGLSIIRAMPNTPALIGQGFTVCVGCNLDPDHKVLAGKLLTPLGTLEWIDDESLMDAVTAISGSGPAYVFY